MSELVVHISIVFIVGIVFGSFANVLIYRIPKELSVVKPGSACTNCDEPIPFYYNVPIFSYLLLGGKTKCCNEKLSYQYPLIELISGLFFVIVYIKLGFGVDAFLIGTIFILLLVLSIIDIKFLVAHDSINLATLTLALFAYGTFLENIQGALLIGGGMAFLRFYLSFILQKEAMGEGDIIIGGTMGALLGVQLSMVAVFVSAVIALPIVVVLIYFMKKDPEVPYIPFLALATFLVFLFDTEFNHLFWSIY